MAGTVGVNFSIGAQLSRTVTSAFSTVSSRVRGLKSDLNELKKQDTAVTRMQAASDKLRTAQAKYAANSSAKMRAAVRTAAISYRNARKEVAEYGLAVENAGRAQEQLAQRIQRTQAALSRQQRLQANQAKRSELQGQMLGIVGAAMTVAAPIRLASQQQDAFVGLEKVAKFASEEQKKQVQKIINDAALRAGISTVDVTGMATAAGEAGVINDEAGNLDPQQMKDFLRQTTEMAVAADLPAEKAGKYLATFMYNMKLSLAETQALGDSVNYMSSKMKASAADTFEVLAAVGPTVQGMGLAKESVAALAATFVATSKAPEVAATALKNFMSTLASGKNMSKDQKDILSKMGIADPLSLSRQFKKGGEDAEQAILTVFQALKKLPEAEQAGASKALFGLESLGSISPLINDPHMLAKSFRDARSSEAIGSQAEEFEKVSKTFTKSMDRLKTSTGILGITVGSVLLPPLATAANIAMAVVKPITALADSFPLVTKAVMLTGIALVGLKVGALAGVYAATMVSDGWTIARGALHFFRPSVIATNTALAWHRTVAVAAAAATKIMAVGAKMAAAGTWLLNAALSNNPIGWVVKGVAGLIAGLVYLYNTCEPVRAAFDAAFTWIGDKVSWVVDKLRAVGEWLGIVDEADATADEKIAEAKTSRTAVEPTSTAAPPLATAAPKEWNPAEAMSGMSPEAAATAFPGMAGGMSTPDMAALSGMGGGTTVNFSVALNGMPDGEFGKRVIDGLKRRQGELESLIASIVDEQRRLAYG